MPAPSLRGDFLRAAVDLAVLGILAKKPLHGFGITQAIRSSDESFSGLHPGTLYPILRRLEMAGWIKGTWVPGQGTRQIRVYEITPAGRMEMKSRKAIWNRMVRALARLVRPLRVAAPIWVFHSPLSLYFAERLRLFTTGL